MVDHPAKHRNLVAKSWIQNIGIKIKTKQKLYTMDICSIIYIGPKWEYMIAVSHTNEQVRMHQVVNAAYLANEAWEA